MAKDPIYLQIRNYIQALIQQNKNNPQYRLPSENQLAQRFNVSRICAKEAYRELEKDHLVHRIRGKGTFINTDNSRALHSEKWISVILPALDSTFLQSILHGICGYFRDTEYNIFVQYSEQNSKLEERQIKAACHNNASGILIYPTDNETYSMELLKLCLNHYPTVVLDRSLPGLTFPLVSADHYQSAYALTKRMLEHGRKTICFFVSQMDRLTSSVAARCLGYEAALQERKLLPHYQFIDKSYDWTEYHNAICSCLDTYLDTDGVIIQSGVPEKIFYKELSSRDLLDKILIAVYDTTLPDYLNPLSELHHIRVTQNPCNIGRTAAETLYEHLEFNAPLKSSTVPFQVLEYPQDKETF